MNPRAYEPLTRAHLDRLANLARYDREGLLQRKPHLKIYENRVLAVALCQGDTLHHIDKRNGVKDLDVWTLCAAHPDVDFPHRRKGQAKFGPSNLSNWAEGVDLLGRSIPYPLGYDAILAWQNYLKAGASVSAQHLAQKAVVMLEPIELRGKVVWPISLKIR